MSQTDSTRSKIDPHQTISRQPIESVWFKDCFLEINGAETLETRDVNACHYAKEKRRAILNFFGTQNVCVAKTLKLVTLSYVLKKRMNMSKPEKAVTKDMLMGMTVIDAEGRSIGSVKDVAFVVGKMGLSLFVEGKKGESRNVSWEEVQGVGDYVVLKPVQAHMQTQQPQAAARTCPTCGSPLRYVEQYQRWWCDKDRKYV